MQIKQACFKFLKGYFSTHERSEKTKSAYCSDINQFQKFIGSNFEIHNLKGSHIESWAAHLKENNFSPSSIRRKIVVLKVFCSYWVRNGALCESPFWRVKISYGRVEQLPRTLTEIEMKRIFSQAYQKFSLTDRQKSKQSKNFDGTLKSSSRNYLTLRNLALLEVMFATGMRVGEVSSLNIRDFHSEDVSLIINGKGGRERLAFIVDEVTIHIMREYIEVRSEIKTEHPALFLNSMGNRLSTQGIAKVISQLREDGGVKRHITPHMLRHTVATLLMRNGVDIRIVQEFLGHASIATTQRYVHVVKEHIIKELRSRHPSLKLRAKAKSLFG